MQIGLIIQHRYPDADPETDYHIQDDGNGARITYWNEEKLGPQPTTDQLRSWWIAAEKWSKKNQFRVACDAEYRSILAPEGIFTELEKDEILEKKAAIRAGVNALMNVAQQQASSTIDLLRQKRIDRFKAVNDVTQGTNETVEDAVARVRAVTWQG